MRFSSNGNPAPRGGDGVDIAAARFYNVPEKTWTRFSLDINHTSKGGDGVKVAAAYILESTRKYSKAFACLFPFY